MARGRRRVSAIPGVDVDPTMNFGKELKQLFPPEREKMLLSIMRAHPRVGSKKQKGAR